MEQLEMRRRRLGWAWSTWMDPMQLGQWSMVNPVCPIGQPVSGTGGKIVKLFPIHHRLQKSKKSGSSERHKSASIAAISHEGKFFKRQKFVIILSQQYFGRPMRLRPCGCQTITLLIQRCPGSVAKYCARFQWCRKQISDHDLDAVCEVKARTRSFQMWRLSCHGSVQSILRGGPTTDRRSRRYATSILRKSLRYTVGCPAAKHTVGEMTRSKYSSFLAIATFGSQRIHLFALKALAAACSRHSTSHVVVCAGAVVNMHPSHLWLDSLSRTDMINPFGVCNRDGGWACVVKTFVFCTSNCNPTAARFSTSLSKSTPTTWESAPNIKMSSVDLKSSNDRPPSPKFKPKCSISSRQLAIDISNTEQKSRGLKTHPCRAPPCMAKDLLQPLLPTTCPCWSRYKF